MKMKLILKKFQNYLHLNKKIKIFAKFVDIMDAQTNITKIQKMI